MKKFASSLIATTAAASLGHGHAEFKPLNVYSPYYEGNFDFWVKGLDNKCLDTEGAEMSLGQNNRTWVRDRAIDDDLYWVYYHNFLGGTMEFDVDLSAVECASASAVYLVEADDNKCNWNAKEAGEDPQCSRVEIMEANKLGFTAASYPCFFGSCDPVSQTQQRANENQYGPGSSYTINTEKPFKVTTKFYAPEDEPETFGDLVKIETTLSQDGGTVVLVQDDADYLWGISYKLYASMAVVVSNFDAGESNNISGGQCTSPSGEYKSKFSNFRFTMYDSKSNEDSNPQPDPSEEFVIGELAQSLDECEMEDCSACHMAWPANNPDDIFPMCTDFTQYKYQNICGRRQSTELCGEDDLCFRSWPHDDPAKRRSENYACRPLPSRLMEGDFKFAKRSVRGRKGLCYEGCETTCHMSWPVGDDARWKSPDAMFRCKDEF